MRQSRPLYLILSGAVLILMLTLITLPRSAEVFAQADTPAAETPTEQPTEPPTATNTPEPTETPDPTDTPIPTATAEPTETEEPTDVPTSTPTAPPAPVAIPEPITVVLFGTGLAALSAAAASRRKNAGKDDSE